MAQSQRRGKDRENVSHLNFASTFLIVQNLIGVILSVPVLVIGILVVRAHKVGGEECAKFMQRPIIAMGVLLLIVSLAGLIVAIINQTFSSNHPLLTGLHLLLTFCLVILLFSFAIFSLEITNKGIGHMVTAHGQTYKENRLNQYPKWMRRKVEDGNYWNDVKTCLKHSSACNPSDLPYIFSNITLSPLDNPIKVGCCIPPIDCNAYIYSRVTTDKVEENVKKDVVKENLHAKAKVLHIRQGKLTGLQESETLKATINTTSEGNHDAATRQNTSKMFKTTVDASINTTERNINNKAMSTTLRPYTRDCKKWSMVPDKLCYDCDTCKAGVIQASMNRWKLAGIMYVVLVIVMIVLYFLFACYGFVEEKEKVHEENQRV